MFKAINVLQPKRYHSFFNNECTYIIIQQASAYIKIKQKYQSYIIYLLRYEQNWKQNTNFILNK